MSLTKVSYSMISGAPYNVLDYGADPTGVADSTAAFQAAIGAYGDNREIFTFLLGHTL
jgi:polygalacturonase